MGVRSSSENAELPLRVVFGNQERSLTIQAPAGPVLDAVHGMFGGALLPTADPEGPDGPADLVVSGSADGYDLRARTDPVVQRFRTTAELVGAIEFGVTHFLLGAHPEATHLHAAGAVAAPAGEGAPAILALGPSGSGKSSLALAWSRSGLPLLGDDVVLVDARGRLAPFPRPVRVGAERLREVGASVGPAALVDEATREARYDATEGAGWAGPGARAAVVARIRWAAGAPVRVEPLSAAEGLQLLVGSVLGTGVSPLASFPRFADALHGARLVEVRFGNAVQAADALRELLP
jgi:hypothetical protein